MHAAVRPDHAKFMGEAALLDDVIPERFLKAGSVLGVDE